MKSPRTVCTPLTLLWRRPAGSAALVVLASSSLACGPTDMATVAAGSLEVALFRDGTVASFKDRATGTEYLPHGAAPALLTLRAGGEDLPPISATYDDGESVVTLTYGDGLEARVAITRRETHARLEILSISRPERVELAVWGPYPTTIDSLIGETVGVVRGPTFAMGLLSLNPRTLGGYPWNENDAMPQLDIFESGDYDDLSEEGKRAVLYRVEAAKPDSLGSTLQAYVRDRSRTRIVPNWGHERYVVPPFHDDGVVGSAIALFGSPVEEALATVGAIEVAERLPHPTIDGEWGKTARTASAAYVILPFGEATLDRAVEITLQAGLRYLYHGEPFRTWGHFPLDPDFFPNGVEGLREAVERAEARGVMLGVHVLSNFITTDDAYVTPVPDPRLARVGTATLEEAVSATATELPLAEPDFFGPSAGDNLHAAVVGDEIVRFRALSTEAPWRLLDVERGAFGTAAAAHEAGTEVGRLADHGYRVFLSDADLTVEMARTLADLFNRTGLRQISFDGLEGNRSTGMGNYGEILMTHTWYEALSEDIRGHYIADASRTSHYFWHVYTRMNWGEPWYAGFRESQTEYRLKNQAYFRRNMMPGMLGWFRMQAETSVEDIQWMLARSAAFDAGYALVTSFDAVDGNGRSDRILDLIGRWEAARMADAFSAEQKRHMEDIANEFHLDGSGDGPWTLYQIHAVTHRLAGGARQPGEPSARSFPFTNPVGEQTSRFLLTAEGGPVRNVILELDGVARLEIPGRLETGETLAYEGGNEAVVYSGTWQRLRQVPLRGRGLTVLPGDHEMVVDAELGEGVQLRVELRLWSEGEAVGVR